MTMFWSCPQAECPPTDRPPRDVEELGEVADGSQDVLSIQEVTKLLNVPVSTIYAWNRHGVGPPHYKVGRKLRYRKSDARKWLAEHLVSRAVCSSECGATYRRRDFEKIEA
jgi:excisionase family DNA binding protein